jgi:hypothetical protein
VGADIQTQFEPRQETSTVNGEKRQKKAGQFTPLRYQHGGRITQQYVLAQFMTNLCNSLETEFLGAHSNTANITEYIPLGNTLRLLKTFKRHRQVILAFSAMLAQCFK